MKLDRRAFLAGVAATTAAPVFASEQGYALEPRAGVVQQLGPGGTGPATLWGYNGSAPGPVIRGKQGVPLKVRLKNALEVPTTVHWHGIRIENAMDGVAGLTQAPVAPGDAFEYAFVPPDAGTYWYHPHFRSWDQLARGLYGALIIEEEVPIAVDRDLPLVLDDWQLTEAGGLDLERLGAMHDWSHAGALGNWPTVNGAPQPEIGVRRNERLRLRLINAANATVLVPVLRGMEAVVVALDGQPVAPRPLGEDTAIAPGQRVDVIADVLAEEAAELRLGGREDFLMARFSVAGAARAAPLRNVAPLAPSALRLPRGPLREVRLRMEGGAMRWLESAKVGGRWADARGLAQGPMSGRDLADESLFWSMNGLAGMPDAPLFSVPRGGGVRLTFENATRFDHGMHLHGHHVWDEVDQGWRDTVLVRAGQAARTVLLNADNPGKWMLHCHMLEHQAAGMATWFEVV